MPRADIKRGAHCRRVVVACCFYCCCGCYYPVWQTLEQLDNVFGFRLCVWQETEIIVGRTHVSMPSGPRGNTKQEQDKTAWQATRLITEAESEASNRKREEATPSLLPSQF